MRLAVYTPLPNCIAGVSGGSNISELWREQFSELLNCISDTTDGIDCHCCYTDEMMVSVNEVNECITQIACERYINVSIWLESLHYGYG